MPYKDPAKQREARERWRKNNREKENNARRASRAANPEKHRESTRLWRERNLEREREKDRIFGTNHREVLRERYRRWREANPDGMILGQARYYLSKRLGGKPPEEMVEMFALQRLIKREIKKAPK